MMNGSYEKRFDMIFTGSVKIKGGTPSFPITPINPINLSSDNHLFDLSILRKIICARMMVAMSTTMLRYPNHSYR